MQDKENDAGEAGAGEGEETETARCAGAGRGPPRCLAAPDRQPPRHCGACTARLRPHACEARPKGGSWYWVPAPKAPEPATALPSGGGRREERSENARAPTGEPGGWCLAGVPGGKVIKACPCV